MELSTTPVAKGTGTTPRVLGPSVAGESLRVRRGSFCVYRPNPARPVRWEA
jgi:hypothetical protein